MNTQNTYTLRLLLLLHTEISAGTKDAQHSCTSKTKATAERQWKMKKTFYQRQWLLTRCKLPINEANNDGLHFFNVFFFLAALFNFLLRCCCGYGCVILFCFLKLRLSFVGWFSLSLCHTSYEEESIETSFFLHKQSSVFTFWSQFTF